MLLFLSLGLRTALLSANILKTRLKITIILGYLLFILKTTVNHHSISSFDRSTKNGFHYFEYSLIIFFSKILISEILLQWP